MRATGPAFLAAVAVAADGEAPLITDWNPITERITPNAELRTAYDTLFDRYVRLYDGTKGVVHELAAEQRGTSSHSTPEES